MRNYKFSPWEEFRAGNTREALWNAYRRNLRNSAIVLTNRVNGRTNAVNAFIITERTANFLRASSQKKLNAPTIVQSQHSYGCRKNNVHFFAGYFSLLTFHCFLCAGVVELADAPDSKSGGGNSVWVQLPPPAPYNLLLQELLPVHDKYIPKPVRLISIAHDTTRHIRIVLLKRFQAGKLCCGNCSGPFNFISAGKLS